MKVNVFENSVELVDTVSFPELIRETSESCCLNGKADDAFFVCDLGDIARKHALWSLKLPRIEPFYAMKCNPNPMVVRLLAGLNVGFDCASKGEMMQAIGSGVPPERIIYANPCKQASHLKYAQANGVRLLTFDSAAEVRKIHALHPDALLVLRVFAGATKARCPLGLKFGASLADVPSLIRLALDLGLSVVGVSFHVGSGCFDASAYRYAISLAYQAFEISASLGNPLSILDIGGGFPGNLDTEANAALFEDVCTTINSSIDQLFPIESGVRVIAEPGRFYVSSAFQLACTVTSMRATTNTAVDVSEQHFSYFLNDGVYGSFNCIFFDHYLGDFYMLSGDGAGNEKTYPSVFWGPTCDSIDKILDNFFIRKISVGERVVFKNMGAYTMAASSTFNGFEAPFIKYVFQRSDWYLMASLLEEKACASETESDNSYILSSSPEPSTISAMFVEGLSEVL